MRSVVNWSSSTPAASSTSCRYDGRTGDKSFGEPLPASLQLRHLEVCAGRSTQATLLGRTDVTYESLYLSPALRTAPSGAPHG